jgi:hypothetical protein
MPAFTLSDLIALAWFLTGWIVYSIVIEKTAKDCMTLNALMNDYRDEWMERMLARDMRMVDAQVTVEWRQFNSDARLAFETGNGPVKRPVRPSPSGRRSSPRS